MTVIYQGNAETRRVTVTGGGRAVPLSDRHYSWGDERTCVDLARDLVAHINGAPSQNLLLVARFGARHVAKWRKDRPFMFSADTLRQEIEKIDAELEREEEGTRVASASR